MAKKKKRWSPAQIANQFTNQLKGDIQNARLSSLRVGVRLARVRDEKLWKLLKYANIESWAETRLGLSRASLYRYLQVHDWVKERYPSWLAPKPTGFIPEITDIAILRKIEARLDGRMTPERRKLYEGLRDEALAGKLTEEEFKNATREGRKATTPLRRLARSLRTAARRAENLRGVPADLLRDLSAIAERFDALARSRAELVTLLPAVRRELAVLGLPSFASMHA